MRITTEKNKHYCGLRGLNEVWCTEKNEVDGIVVEYFNNLFNSSNPTEITEVVQHVDGVVSQAMNDKLLLPVLPSEIKTALFQICPSKAPGLDGMFASFFSKILAYSR